MRKPGSNGNETRRNLRAAAVKLLFKHGYENMNLRMLAKSIGIRVGSLYNYFDSKQELLFWLLTESHQRLLIKLEEVSKAVADPEAQIRSFVASHLGYNLGEREEASVLAMEAAHRLSRKNFRTFSGMQREYNDKLCAIVQRGVAMGKFRTPDAKLATFAVIQLLTGVIRWYKVDGKFTPNQLIAIYTDLILNMLGVRTIAENTSRSKVAPRPDGNRTRKSANAVS